VKNQVSLSELVPDLKDLMGGEVLAAMATLGMDFSSPDAVPAGELNEILWHVAKGWDTPYPQSEHGAEEEAD